jgi:voltage-gated potassium channel
MNGRRLYLVLNPDSPAQAARLFRVVHHVLVALGIAAMLADSVPLIAADYDPILRAGYYLVGTFFVAEYVLRLIVAPQMPGYEHCGALRARLLWAVSLGGILDFLCAVPAIAALALVTAVVCGVIAYEALRFTEMRARVRHASR